MILKSGLGHDKYDIYGSNFDLYKMKILKRKHIYF